MIGGSLIVAVCLLILGWTAEIVGLFVTELETVSGHLYAISSVNADIDSAGQILHGSSGGA